MLFCLYGQKEEGGRAGIPKYKSFDSTPDTLSTAAATSATVAKYGPPGIFVVRTADGVNAINRSLPQPASAVAVAVLRPEFIHVRGLHWRTDG